MRFIFDSNTWQEIYGSIRKNKVRTIITVIGVLWGIFIYIALSGAAQGVDNAFEKQFETMAMNSLFVWAQNTSKPYQGFKTGRPLQLKLHDGERLQNRIPEIQFIAPRNAKGVFGDSAATVVHGMKAGNYAIYGDYPISTKIATKQIYERGRFINDEDIDQARKVCVIGERNQEELFEKNEDPIGSYIRIDNIYFQVIGVHKFKPGGGFESDNDVYIPFTTFQKLYNTGDNVNWFSVAAYDDADIMEVEAEVKSVLKSIHQVHPEDERAFGSFNLGQIFKRISNFAKGLTFMSLVVGIATILAGVIGIGNILLISVKERTKELGVRRALGATPREVRAQIIMESVFLTVIAGIMGIIIGAVLLNMLNSLTEGNDQIPFVNPTVPIPAVLGAMAIMIILGTLIGLIPAQRAVSIKPIDALREE